MCRFYIFSSYESLDIYDGTTVSATNIGTLKGIMEQHIMQVERHTIQVNLHLEGLFKLN